MPVDNIKKILPTRLAYSKAVFIIAGGASLLEIKPNTKLMMECGYVLGVNESGVLLPCNGVLSMDRLWFENRWQQVKEKGLDFFMRWQAHRVKSSNITWQDLHIIDMDEKGEGLSEDPAKLHGDNSGFCALNLAYLAAPNYIFLFGFDMHAKTAGKPHWHENYKWNERGRPSKYKNWIKNFDLAQAKLSSKNITVINCSPKSSINSFQKTDWKKEQTKWLNLIK